MTIGKFPAVSAKDAGKGASILAGQVCCGRCPSSERKAARRSAVVASAPIKDGVDKAVRAYLKFHRARVRPSTYRETARVMSKEVLPHWRSRRLEEITKQDIRSLIDRIARRPAPVSANRTLASVKAFCTWAVAEDLISASPAASVRPPSVEKARERTLTDSELSAVWRASLELGEYGAIVRLLALCGGRRSEVFGMQWAEIDPGAKMWTLPASRAKNGCQHSVPLSDVALDVLRSLCPTLETGGPAAPVFGAMSFSREKGMLDALLPAGMPAWCVHDLRRTAASGMAGLGVQPHVIEAVLNHRSGVIRGVAAVYNRFNYAAEKRNALDLWGAHVAALPAPPLSCKRPRDGQKRPRYPWSRLCVRFGHSFSE
jgi:integrase